MGRDDVAEGPGAFHEVRPALDVQLLGQIDLYVAHVLVIPHRLEQSVGEPQCQNVLHGLLAQEMVDPVDLSLVEHLMQRRIELPGRRQVGAERLLEDHLGALCHAELAERADSGLGR
ncbi:MAG: hypothetical protein ABT15_32460 [Pseudonocardia sp. SCN 73-27]|nr:MAG: hypothetical protein ABS80_11080 [Pseudonocardia sp. SCN 72-51]ODU99122.1 MAG: hypothetical protein ABT15_32460 [Pseudonocardia sp. SCN 73-27]